MEKRDLIALFERQADKYEKKRKKKTIDLKWREKLLSSIRGRTLEVSVGAGNNFKFYPSTINLTAVDYSPAMLEKAIVAANEHDIQAEFILSDVENLQFPNNYFDTIVSTLSLCAYDNPVNVLNFFNQWCKKDGQILLLEHGISSFHPYAWIQNKMNYWQVRKIGCHANRDILGIVADSNVVVEKYESHLLGSVYLIWGKKTKNRVEI